mmetsp:Transcript_42515/g.51628  ORF Transcript_42515/g.51628 Transcript_42515/m.51628 type:complete len:109 (+) Transcript_42515:130-456(+)|eukprot:CAMPEP_0197860718 /NCGR_PEP_ID=MMETSP1438-20131217/36306_1 /TAXON_ID=1461541 /ORGANISM="Pterosperma sp., Strain CCMP1384" /LENGTH=108 /DNA_ID=CAMNT_0043477685 /DNA_START=129 /DNA_END=455 /DNA_ORIENTATION=-
MAEGVWQEWVKKEYISTMRSKGKMDEPTSIAKEQKSREHNTTMQRVFPQRDEKQNSLQPAVGTRPPAGISNTRAELKAKIAKMEKEFDKERSAKSTLEAEVNNLIAQR